MEMPERKDKLRRLSIFPCAIVRWCLKDMLCMTDQAKGSFRSAVDCETTS